MQRIADVSEHFENALQPVCRDSDAIVADRHHYLIGIPLDHQPDLSTGVGKLCGIAQQVQEDLLKPDWIGHARS